MFENNIKKVFLLFFLATIFSVVTREKEEPIEVVKCELIEVIDGDTISVLYNGTQSSVRLIGVDTPESVHTDESKNTEYGIIASNYTKGIFADVQYVYLEFDVSKYDTYNRLLAYVYLTESNTDIKNSINYMLVGEGYALNKDFAPNIKYSTELSNACKRADLEDKGLWIYEDIEAIWK